MSQVHFFLPSVKTLNNELNKNINQRVLLHLENILKDLAKDHHINYQQLHKQYLQPLILVASHEIPDEPN